MTLLLEHIDASSQQVAIPRIRTIMLPSRAPATPLTTANVVRMPSNPPYTMLPIYRSLAPPCCSWAAWAICSGECNNADACTSRCANALRISLSLPDLVITTSTSNDAPKNVIIKEFVKDISNYMQNADLIITQAGHSTAMEILTLGKPALIIPDEGQLEQENNASRMKGLGVCETLGYSTLNPESLFEKINLLLNDPGFREKSRQYSMMSRTMNGSRKAADIIQELSGRIQCY